MGLYLLMGHKVYNLIFTLNQSTYVAKTGVGGGQFIAKKMGEKTRDFCENT